MTGVQTCALPIWKGCVHHIIQRVRPQRSGPERSDDHLDRLQADGSYGRHDDPQPQDLESPLRLQHDPPRHILIIEE